MFLERVGISKISSHPGIGLLQSVLRVSILLSNAGIKCDGLNKKKTCSCLRYSGLM